jgi:hypothetical protein
MECDVHPVLPEGAIGVHDGGKKWEVFLGRATSRSSPVIKGGANVGYEWNYSWEKLRVQR